MLKTIYDYPLKKGSSAVIVYEPLRKSLWLVETSKTEVVF